MYKRATYLILILSFLAAIRASQFAFSLEAQAKPITAMAWSSNGEKIAIGYENGIIEIYNAQTNEMLQSLQHHTARILNLAWSFDDLQLASASLDESVAAWDIATGNLINVANLPGEVVSAILLEPGTNNLFIASAFGTYSMRVWNPDTGEIIQSISNFTLVLWELSCGIQTTIV